LGDYYAASGLNSLAISSYCTAKNLVKTLEDKELYEEELRDKLKRSSQFNINLSRDCEKDVTLP
jgi:hypothetical protein